MLLNLLKTYSNQYLSLNYRSDVRCRCE